jgi:EAL domain-containing protein (putative c-di-GMP-specific phosphodiesterase class I)
MTAGHEQAALARAVVQLGRTLRLTVVAEGIETAEQLTDLRALGCHLGQGFLWSPGRTASDLGAVLVESATPAR